MERQREYGRVDVSGRNGVRWYEVRREDGAAREGGRVNGVEIERGRIYGVEREDEMEM
jgi:hypothetical protein